jgi:hypothetical protein
VRNLVHIRYSMALGALLGAPAFAAGLNVGVELPRLSVAEYHRPYVAVWIERADNSVAANLATWYQVGKRDNEGTKWLKDLRQWWRRTGRELAMPVDGVSSATRPAGTHQLQFTEGSKPLGTLAPGEYKLVVEAAREAGGHEVVSLPFTWPAAPGAQLKAQGSSELGTVTLDAKP